MKILSWLCKEKLQAQQIRGQSFEMGRICDKLYNIQVQLHDIKTLIKELKEGSAND